MDLEQRINFGGHVIELTQHGSIRPFQREPLTLLLLL